MWHQKQEIMKISDQRPFSIVQRPRQNNVVLTRAPYFYGDTAQYERI